MVNSARHITSVLAWCLTLIAAGSAEAQSTIALRPVVRLGVGEAAVTLADVADLAGEEATRLAATPLSEVWPAAGKDGWRRLDVEQVRSVLSARKDVNWGRVTLVGHVCMVRRDEPEPVKPEAKPDETSKTPEEVDDTGTVRATVRAKIAEVVRASPDRLRLKFEDNDRELLGMATAGRFVEVQPVGQSDRMPLQVTVYEGERILASGTVRVDVRIKRPVLVVRQGLTRGQKIGPEDVTSDEQWLPSKARPATAASVIGTVAKTAVRAGKVLEEADAESPVIVRKGELVAVHCLAGLVKVETIGRALQNGRDGDVIPFQAQDSKRVFQARMSGHGRAVAVATGEADADPKAKPGRTPSDDELTSTDKRPQAEVAQR